MRPRHLVLAALAAWQLPSFAQAQPAGAERHTIQLDDVEMSAFIQDVSTLTGYTFIVHPDVRRTRVTLVAQKAMSADEVFDVFLSALRVHGFTAVPAGTGVFRILPEQVAVGEAASSADQRNLLVTEILKLDNFSAVDAAQMLKPLVDAQGQVVANIKSNTIVIVDYASNMGRLRQIVGELDKDMTRTETLSLRNVPAREMEEVLNKMQGGERSEASAQADFSVVASQTSNAIVIRGKDPAVERALKVASELDRTDPVRDNIRVVTLSNANAEELVPILERVGASMTAQKAPGESASGGPTIAHHGPTNSLVISADYETLLAMEKVIAALDVRRAQVLVEAIIVEMSDDAARELGLQFLLAGTEGSQVPFATTNFSRAAPNLLALTGALVTDGFEDVTAPNTFRDAALSSLLATPGLSLGLGGQEGDTLFGVILNAVENDTNSRILSTPFGMTLDNATSSLIVGQEIPITTGEVLGNNNSNPFRTVERKEVGVKLDVTPRIGEADTVRLDIVQEVSGVFGSVGVVTQDLIVDKREITTSVIADDGEIIVLGGLVEQTDTNRATRVPVLGDIPVLGRMFRSQGRQTTRTNLMVFIKPTIVRDREDARMSTSRKFLTVRADELMRGIEDDASIGAFINRTLGNPAPVD